jgi:hypothetical protein
MYLSNRERDRMGSCMRLSAAGARVMPVLLLLACRSIRALRTGDRSPGALTGFTWNENLCSMARVFRHLKKRSVLSYSEPEEASEDWSSVVVSWMRIYVHFESSTASSMVWMFNARAEKTGVAGSPRDAVIMASPSSSWSIVSAMDCSCSLRVS